MSASRASDKQTCRLCMCPCAMTVRMEVNFADQQVKSCDLYFTFKGSKLDFLPYKKEGGDKRKLVKVTGFVLDLNLSSNNFELDPVLIWWMCTA